MWPVELKYLTEIIYMHTIMVMLQTSTLKMPVIKYLAWMQQYNEHNWNKGDNECHQGNSSRIHLKGEAIREKQEQKKETKKRLFMLSALLIRTLHRSPKISQSDLQMPVISNLIFFSTNFLMWGTFFYWVIKDFIGKKTELLGCTTFKKKQESKNYKNSRSVLLLVKREWINFTYFKKTKF